MKKYHLIFILGIVSLTLSQCKVFDNDVIVPGYVYVPEYKFVTPGDNSQGDSSSKIVDVWIYNQGSLEGAIGFPALIPIAKNGPTEIGLDAGVLRTGQNNERIPYPLLTREYFTVDLKPNQVDTLRPVFKYNSSCVFKMVEDFDRAGFRFDYNLKLPGDTVLPISGDSAINKNKKSGLIRISAATDIFSLTTTEFYSLAGFGTPCFLELDYNTDAILFIGLIVKNGSSGDITTVPVYNAFPTDGWKKAYIDLTQEVSAKPQGSTFKIYINVNKGAGTPSPKIILDNIKLIQG
jgi:hypothetical protein